MVARAITLLTDFGTADGYVAAIQGVIAAACPDISMHHAAHDIPPGDIAAGSFALARYWSLFPPGTVHLCVVDPGVGSERRAIVVEADGRLGVGPDNGVLEPMISRATSINAITNPDLMRQPVSATFHGRDIFAPVAAWLACGGITAAVGPLVDRPVRLASPAYTRRDRVVEGVVVAIDRFGNLITNIPAEEAHGSVSIGNVHVGPVRTTYASAASGDVLAVIGSTGVLEISVRDGSAAARMDVKRGDSVQVLDES